MQIHPQVTISDPLLGTHQGKTHPLCFIYRVTTNSKATGTQKFSLFFLSWSDGRGNGAILGLSEAPGEEWVSLGKAAHTNTDSFRSEGATSLCSSHEHRTGRDPAKEKL